MEVNQVQGVGANGESVLAREVGMFEACEVEGHVVGFRN